MKKLQAFTISETLVTLSVIGIITILSISVLFNSETRKEKMSIMTSRELFFNIDKIYQDILISNCSIMNKISSLKDINKDNEIDSKDIRDIILDTYGGEKLNSCDELIAPSDFSKTDMACANLMPSAIIGVYFDKNCSTSINTCESYNQTPKNYTKTCGYIAYSLKKSKGELGKDFFVYPMINKTIMKKTIKPKQN